MKSTLAREIKLGPPKASTRNQRGRASSLPMEHKRKSIVHQRIAPSLLQNYQNARNQRIPQRVPLARHVSSNQQVSQFGLSSLDYLAVMAGTNQWVTQDTLFCAALFQIAKDLFDAVLFNHPFEKLRQAGLSSAQSFCCQSAEGKGLGLASLNLTSRLFVPFFLDLGIRELSVGAWSPVFGLTGLALDFFMQKNFWGAEGKNKYLIHPKFSKHVNNARCEGDDLHPIQYLLQPCANFLMAYAWLSAFISFLEMMQNFLRPLIALSVLTIPYGGFGLGMIGFAMIRSIMTHYSSVPDPFRKGLVTEQQFKQAQRDKREHAEILELKKVHALEFKKLIMNHARTEVHLEHSQKQADAKFEEVTMDNIMNQRKKYNTFSLLGPSDNHQYVCCFDCGEKKQELTDEYSEFLMTQKQEREKMKNIHLRAEVAELKTQRQEIQTLQRSHVYTPQRFYDDVHLDRNTLLKRAAKNMFPNVLGAGFAIALTMLNVQNFFLVYLAYEAPRLMYHAKQNFYKFFPHNNNQRNVQEIQMHQSRGYRLLRG